MYYIIYGFFYLLSLLPWWVIYRISDGVYLLVYYVIGYRKKLVMSNLLLAFPEKTEKERRTIAKAFYRGFCDTFLETIKILSISEKELRRRITVNGAEVESIYATGQSIQFLGGHFMNWEYANHGVTLQSKFPSLGVYMQLSNKTIDRIMYNMRSKFGTILLPASSFKSEFKKYDGEPYVLLLAADQKPGHVATAYWLNFFGKPAPFVKGPEKAARLNNTAIVYANYYSVKRGYYNCDLTVVTTTPRSWPEGSLTRKFKTLTEEAIRKNPACYLWTHNRWKHNWNPEYASLWIDEMALPTEV